jgi:hypothetical protein
MAKVTKCVLVLENCESLLVDVSKIWRVSISDVHTNYYVQNDDRFDSKWCKYARLEIEGELEAALSFDNEAVQGENPVSGRLLRHKDVTWIGLEYDDGSKVDVAVPWRGPDFINKAVYISTRKLYDDSILTSIEFDGTHPVVRCLRDIRLAIDVFISQYITGPAYRRRHARALSRALSR